MTRLTISREAPTILAMSEREIFERITRLPSACRAADSSSARATRPYTSIRASD